MFINPNFNLLRTNHSVIYIRLEHEKKKVYVVRTLKVICKLIVRTWCDKILTTAPLSTVT